VVHDSYFAALLAAGARPFRHRRRLRVLLGVPDDDGPALLSHRSLASADVPPALPPDPYVLPGDHHGLPHCPSARLYAPEASAVGESTPLPSERRESVRPEKREAARVAQDPVSTFVDGGDRRWPSTGADGPGGDPLTGNASPSWEDRPARDPSVSLPRDHFVVPGTTARPRTPHRGPGPDRPDGEVPPADGEPMAPVDGWRAGPWATPLEHRSAYDSSQPSPSWVGGVLRERAAGAEDGSSPDTGLATMEGQSALPMGDYPAVRPRGVMRQEVVQRRWPVDAVGRDRDGATDDGGASRGAPTAVQREHGAEPAPPAVPTLSVVAWPSPLAADRTESLDLLGLPDFLDMPGRPALRDAGASSEAHTARAVLDPPALPDLPPTAHHSPTPQRAPAPEHPPDGSVPGSMAQDEPVLAPTTNWTAAFWERRYTSRFPTGVLR
jgi:hypothetical protein